MKYLGWIIVIILVAGCSSGGQLDMSKYEKFVINNKTISESDAEDIIDVFSDLESTFASITDEPTYIIYAYPDASDKSYDLYAVYLPNKLVFPGDHFEALANDFKGRQSRCYTLDDTAVEILESFK